ncbi:MAG TPA: STAS/SEC14 domain-containing protein [Cytophagales bacterium]|nr:STAS/SEC14 domain-containing protein [Cytophagales bacterium]
MWIENGILVGIYEDVVIDLEAAKAVLKDRLELINGQSYPCFVDGRKVKYWTNEARVFQAGENNNVGMKAAALYVKSHTLKIVVNFYLLINKPNVPQYCFTSQQKAFKWLEQFKD